MPGSANEVRAGQNHFREDLKPDTQSGFTGFHLYGRGEVWFNGGFEYNDANTQRQEEYSLTNFRAGLRWRYAFVEGWIKNAFDTRYIPIAFAFGSFAPSGFLGEMGPPRRVGVTMGVTF